MSSPSRSDTLPLDPRQVCMTNHPPKVGLLLLPMGLEHTSLLAGSCSTIGSSHSMTCPDFGSIGSPDNFHRQLHTEVVRRRLVHHLSVLCIPIRHLLQLLLVRIQACTGHTSHAWCSTCSLQFGNTAKHHNRCNQLSMPSRREKSSLSGRLCHNTARGFVTQYRCLFRNTSTMLLHSTHHSCLLCHSPHNPWFFGTRCKLLQLRTHGSHCPGHMLQQTSPQSCLW